MQNPGVEYIRFGVPIEVDDVILQREAQKAQGTWFADPDSIECKHRFASALRRWAACTKNPRALAHAKELMGE